MEISSSPEALARFKKKLESYAPLPDKDFQLWAETMHEKEFKKGEVLLKEGQVCKQYYYILTGSIRSFSLEKGREVNVKFYFEDDFVSDFESFRMEKPSAFYFVAMEDTKVLYATRAEALPVLRSDTSFYIFLFRFFQTLYFNEAEHSNSFKLLSPEERYRYLIEHQPHYLQRVPLTHLATYLGMSRETLTRIRKKIS